METAPVSRRRQWLLSTRLSLKTLMVLVLVFGGGFGWVVRRARVQREAVAAIERAGGSVVYDWQVITNPGPGGGRVNLTARSPWPKWLVDAVGVDMLQTVRHATVPGEADDVLASVARLDGLDCLTVGEIRFAIVTDAGRIERGPVLTDVGLARIRGLSRLTEFRVVGGAHVSKAGLEHLETLTRLRLLHLDDIRLSEDDLAPIGRIKTLEEFSLNELSDLTGDGRPRRFTDASLAHLKGLTGLKTLSLNDTQLTPAGLKHLSGMTGLRQLSLPGSRVHDLAPLSTLTGLRTLVLNRSPVDDAGLAPVANLPALQSLSLNGTRVTDAGLVPLASLPALRQLSLDETAITDAGLTRLQVSPRLTTLSVTGTRITGGAYQAFRQARPDVRTTRQSPWLQKTTGFVGPSWTSGTRKK